MLRKEHASDAVSVATDVSRLFWHNAVNIDFGVSPYLNSLMVHMQCRQGGMLPAFLFSVDRSDKLLLFPRIKTSACIGISSYGTTMAFPIYSTVYVERASTRQYMHYALKSISKSGRKYKTRLLMQRALKVKQRSLRLWLFAQSTI